MSSGLQVFGADGRIHADMSWFISQHQGSFDTGAVNGSGTMIDLPAGKSRFYIVVPLQSLDEWRGKRPGVTISGNTISWAYQFSSWFGQFAANCRIYYGYY